MIVFNHQKHVSKVSWNIFTFSLRFCKMSPTLCALWKYLLTYLFLACDGLRVLSGRTCDKQTGDTF